MISDGNLNSWGWYLEQGWRLIPVFGKRPLLPDWTNTASANPQTIHEWLSKYPHCGLALLLGDLIDVETDSSEGTEALRSIIHSESYPCWKSHRGIHSLWKRPSTPLPEVAKIECLGIECRLGNTRGAHSVLPPSPHPDGGQYTWIRHPKDFPIQPLPTPLIVLIWLRHLRCPDIRIDFLQPIPAGNRNTRLTEICGHWARGRPQPNLILQYLRWLNELCVPPLEHQELETIVNSICKRESQKTQTQPAHKASHDFRIVVVKDTPYRFRLSHHSWPRYIECSAAQLYSFTQVRNLAAEQLRVSLSEKYRRHWSRIIESLLPNAEEIEPESPEMARRTYVAYSFWRWLDEHLPERPIPDESIQSRIGTPQKLQDGTVIFQFASALESLHAFSSFSGERITRRELCQLLNEIQAGHTQRKRRRFIVLDEDSLSRLATLAQINHERSLLGPQSTGDASSSRCVEH